MAAFGLSLVACCPPLSVLAIGLGIVALLQIGRSEVTPRGRTLAIAAMVIGAIGLVGTAAVVRWHDRVYRRQLETTMLSELDAVIAFARRGDGIAVRDRWSDGVTRPTPDAVARFGAELDARYGAVRGMSIVRQRAGGSMTAPTLEVALTFTFERRTLVGSAEFALVPVPGTLHPQVRVRNVDLEDDIGGDLSLP